VNNNYFPILLVLERARRELFCLKALAEHSSRRSKVNYGKPRTEYLEYRSTRQGSKTGLSLITVQPLNCNFY